MIPLQPVCSVYNVAEVLWCNLSLELEQIDSRRYLCGGIIDEFGSGIPI